MKSLKGHLLIASPSLVDPNFHKTVVLLFDHSGEGAAGVVINRPTDTTISSIADQAFEEMVEWDKVIGVGGPVPGPLIAIHDRSDLADQEVLPGLYTTADANKLRAIVDNRVEPCQFVANYAGWGPGQLESELLVDSWLTLPARQEHIFREDQTELWKDVVREVNSAKLRDILHFEELPSDASMN